MRLLILGAFLVGYCVSFAQEKQHTSYFDLSYFKGNIALHNNDILHLIKGHPEGFILGWNKKTYGFNDWEQRYNYPDYGLSFAYQDLKNDVLGNNFSLYAHYNFYFLKRHLMFRIGQGLAYTTNPYHKEKNFKNVAFGSNIMSSTLVMLNYKKEHIFNNFGLQAGFSLLHYSNANVKAPNASVNSITFNLGVNYNLDEEEPNFQYTLGENDKKFTQPFKYNLAFRTGVNESDVVGSGQFPFYIFSGYVDKRINRKGAFQVGTDVFFSNFLKELIYHKSVSFPEENVSGNEDYKRVGVFAGHELFFNKTSFETQLGYYVYYPFDFEGRTYFRIGLKRYFYDKWFGAITLKSHGAKAEAVEFGIGLRL
ncbi:acyloxyacyl hydrolase [Sabulilitoribacter multivorans]|uniref:Acyloxyacyl hydrolase n=1 Tax=Flaviramulus multivorans TaxID=1304750 RepID=A0ABS9IE93_9FLAO|nr:acyloxyacyl hydrolase [Flaviramulus multivorans]MCF7559107.1 acyloxyacyl hydrolase [Flaviramulus multivorans]